MTILKAKTQVNAYPVVVQKGSNKLTIHKVCYNEAGRQRRDYKEKPKEAKPLTRNTNHTQSNDDRCRKCKYSFFQRC